MTKDAYELAEQYPDLMAMDADLRYRIIEDYRLRHLGRIWHGRETTEKDIIKDLAHIYDSKRIAAEKAEYLDEVAHEERVYAKEQQRLLEAREAEEAEEERAYDEEASCYE